MKKGINIECNITRAQDEAIEALVEKGFWKSRSEFIRHSINKLLDIELEKLRQSRKKTKLEPES